MKQEKMIGIGFAIMNMILAAACIILYIRTDRTAPEFAFQAASVAYREGMDTEGLLAGITAKDSRDGDVTERIVVEKTTEDREGGTVVVFYAVSDSSGNVARASRVFPASFDGTEGAGPEDMDGSFLSAGIDADLKGLPRDTDGSSSEGEAIVNGTGDGLPGSSGNAEDTGIFAGTPSPTPEMTQAPSAAPTPTQTPAPAPTQAAAAPVQAGQAVPTADLAAPVLTLKVSEVTVNAGQGPAWVDIIGVLSDDKDSYETLFGNLVVSRYDKNRAGTYQVSVYTEDSDGNRSQTLPLAITVR